MFTGGALLNGALFALGIMPYISASIIMQLMGAVFPTLARLQQEGEPGRQRLQIYSIPHNFHMSCSGGLAVALRDSPGSLIQDSILLKSVWMVALGPIVIATSPTLFLLNTIIFLTTGSLILMWLGEQITQRNWERLSIDYCGYSGHLPKALSDAYALIFMAPDEDNLVILKGVLMVGLFLIVVAGIIAVTQAQRKIPVQLCQANGGEKVFGGQSSFLPLKVNYAGVMPVILPSAILMFLLNYLEHSVPPLNKTGQLIWLMFLQVVVGSIT